MSTARDDADGTRAGAILPLGDGDGARADVLTARPYTHPALEGRTVVRLVAEAIGPAEDLALEYLGFGAGGAPQPVGRVARQSLGFPAWALVNDPANGHHALAVVKEMERLTRMIAAKPGTAKDGFEEIAARLAGSVPSFLPTYYEQVARLFLTGESRAYATTFFGKARDAERRHGLAVDEERLREVFVEFAGAGALSVKTLREHTRALSARLSPTEALEQFEALCRRRTATGLAPYAGLLEDLRKLAKAAGADVAGREAAMVREALASTSAGQAPMSFWKAARESLIALARQDEAIRRQLLALRPSAGGEGRTPFDTMWLGMLESCGALELLEDGRVPAAAWLSSWADHRQRGWGRHPRSAADPALVERLAARLRADGEPVALESGNRFTTCDLDLLDTCLAAGVPVAGPQEQLALPLSEWLDDDGPGRRDLTALMADPRFEPKLRTALEEVSRQQDGRARLLDLVNLPGFPRVAGGWLADRAAGIGDERRPVLWLEELLKRIGRFDEPAVLATGLEAARALAATDVAPFLAHTLRTGLLSELGWPALEEAGRLLGSAGGHALHDAWPRLIVRDDHRIVLAGADGVVEQRPLDRPVPPQRNGYGNRTTVALADGQWLVTAGWGDERRGVWSGRAGELFVPDGHLEDPQSRGSWISYELPGGGRTFGGRPLRAGDTAFGGGRQLLHDGVSFWALEEGEWREFDPAAGRLGRASLPSFLDEARAGGKLLAYQCELLPCAPGLEGSPFGSKDGLLGWWVREDAGGGTVTACSVDGRRHTVPSARLLERWGSRSTTPLPPLRLPGGAELRPTLRYRCVTLHDADGQAVESADLGGTHHGAVVPPLDHWHMLRPRDEAGSAALRAVTDGTASALLAAVAAGGTPQEAVARVLPAVTHPLLGGAVAATVERAAACAAALTRLAGRAEDGATSATVSARWARDGVLAEALCGVWGSGSYRNGGKDQSSGTLTAVRAVGAFLTGEGTQPAERFGSSEWSDLLGDGLAAALWRAASPTTGEEHRLAIAELAQVVLETAGGLLADPRGRLRLVELDEPSDGSPSRYGTVLTDGERRLLFHGWSSSPRDRRGWTALEFDPAGRFGAWPGLNESHAEVLGTPRDPLRAPVLAELVRLLPGRGALPCVPEAAGRFGELASVDPSVGALLLLSRLPDGWGRDWLPEREELAAYRVPAADAEAAGELLRGLGDRARRRLMAALVPDTPQAVERLWAGEVPVERAAGLWLELNGRRPALPVAMLRAARREGAAPRELLDALTTADRPELTGRTTQSLAEGSLWTPDPSALLTLPRIASYARALAWLAYRLPFGDPLRAGLPEALRRLRERLADEGLLLEIGPSWTPQGDSLAEVVRAAHGLPKDEPAELTPCGPALLTVAGRYRGLVALRAHVVAAAGCDHPDLELLSGLLPGYTDLRALRVVLDEGFARALAADGPEGYPQDPARSVPELVAEASERLGCSADAAALYLMLLALPDPTDRNVALWTGWKPARRTAAQRELAASGAVVEAKRARAGRGLFLPGGWHDHPAPLLPAESWKEGHHDGRDLAAPVARGPVAEVFRAAWARVSAGDAPAYEEFTSRRGGRGARTGGR